jgi:hypothetical protein
MPLTLRPTGLSPLPDSNDWTIHDDGVMVGRIYKIDDGSGLSMRPPATLIRPVCGPRAGRQRSPAPRPHFGRATSMADLVGGTPAGLGIREGLTYIPGMLRKHSKPPAGFPPSMPASPSQPWTWRTSSTCMRVTCRSKRSRTISAAKWCGPRLLVGSAEMPAGARVLLTC